MSETSMPGPFVQKAEIPADTPPVRMTGTLAWIRDNLFSSPLNALATVLCIALAALVIVPVLQFAVINAAWSGNTREACLATQANGPSACWPFVRERLSYFIYGSYPFDERWRVNLYFLLEIISVTWLLWPRLGGKPWALLNLVVIFPAIAYVLLRGAFGLTPVDTDLWGGMLITIVVSTVGIVFSLPVGLLLALGRRSAMPLAKFFSVIFIEFVRGVPLISVLFMANVMLPLFLPHGSQPNKLLRALVAVALFSSAYMAEVIRGGLAAVPKGQHEGGMALGLSYVQRLLFVILPQALRISIPGIVNSFISLFKDTTLVSFVAIFDFVRTISAAAQDPTWSTPYTLYTGFLFAAAVYWIFCFGMSRYSLAMERRLDTGYKR